MATTVDRFGKLDVSVGNAGIFDYGARLVETPLDRLDGGIHELFANNVKAQILGVKAASEALLDFKGSVLLTASMASWHAGVGGVVYTPSKDALVGVVRQLAYELALDVRVNGIAPGLMRTDIRGPSAMGMQDVTPDVLPDLEGIARATPPLAFLPSAHRPLRPVGLPCQQSGHHWNRGGVRRRSGRTRTRSAGVSGVR